MLFDFNEGLQGGILGTEGLGGYIREQRQLSADREGYAQLIELLKNNEGMRIENFNIDSGIFEEMSEDAVESIKNISQASEDGQEEIEGLEIELEGLGEEGAGLPGVFKNIGNSILNGLASMAISAAISLIVVGIQKLITSHEDLMRELNEVAASYNDTQNSLNDYSKKIEELRGVLDSETATTEDVSSATSDLYDIQKELIDTYGSYAEGLDLVNGKLSDQLEIIQDIKEQNIVDTYNKIQGTESFAEKFYRATTLFDDDGYADWEFDNARIIRYAMEHYGEDWNDWTWNYNKGKTIKGVSVDNDTKKYIDKLETISIDNKGNLLVGGYAPQVKSDLESLQQFLQSTDKYNTKWEDQLTKYIEDAKDVIDENETSYKALLDYDVLTDATLSAYKQQIEEVKQAYDDATESGDKKLMESAGNEYGKTMSGILKKIANDPSIDNVYIEYFNDLYPELQSLVSNWELKYKVVPEVQSMSEGLQQYLRDNTTEQIQADYQKYTSLGEDYSNKDGYIIYFQELETVAKNAKKDVDDLVESLHATEEFHYSSGKHALLYQPTQSSYTGVEDQKIADWGLSQYEDQIKNGTIQAVYGNVDMNNRDIIEWNDWNLARFKDALKSWGTEYDEHGNMVRSYYDDLKEAYEEGSTSIDTVYGGSASFEYDGDEHPIAFTPILQTEDGAVFLSSQDVYNYIDKVISKASEDGDLSAKHILEIDAEGIGFQVGNNYVKGIIAGIDNYTGVGGQTIPATTTGMLMHFSGQYGAYSLAKTGEGQGDYTTPTANRISYETLYKRDMAVLTEEEKAHNELVSKWYEGLSDEAKSYFDNIASTLSEEEIEPTFKMNNEFELSNWLYKLQHEADESPIKLKFTVDEGIEKLDELEDKIDSIGDLWDTTVNQVDSSGNAVSGVPSASDIADVNSSFGGVKDENDNYTAMAGSLMSFDSKVTQNIGNVQAQKDAYNELITSSIVLDDTLKELTDDVDNVTEAQKNEYIQMLKNKDIENAEEVVTSRLNKTYKATRANLVALTQALNDTTSGGAKYLDVLESGVREGKDFDETCAGLVDTVRDLVGIYNQETGELEGTFDDIIDADFVKANIEDIIGTFTGVDGALESLYAKVAALNAEKVYIEAGLDDTEIDVKMDNIESMLAIASTWTMEPEALLKNDQFMSALNACWDGSVETANAINAALGTIGMKIQYKTTPRKIIVPASQATASNSKGTNTYENGVSTMKYWTTEEITVDDFEIVSTSTGKGTTGKSANYGGNSSNSSSNGGNGGSDSGSSDDTEETFDWVEVAIDRVEEKIEDLGKTADDVYGIWSNRNQAVADQIDKVTDEIELQTQAAKRYKKEAESINLSQDYKDKIQEGELDIETVTDQDTIDAINDYTDWWNKYKEAEDNAKTLTLSLGDYQKTLFENIETYYDDLITNIEKKVDRIDEQISRTEEYGFFVDRSYYDQQIKLEEQTYTNLSNKRNELINKLNEGLDKGYIKAGSEAWNDMYQSILDVNQAMEESATNTRKLNNEIRQLEWDRFDWIEERMSDFATEADFLIKILQGENNYLDDGNFNNRGFAQAALVGAKYNDTLEKMLRYKEQISEIDAKIAEDEKKYGVVDKENIERKEELVSEYRSAIEAAEDYKQEMQSLVQEGINKHLEALNELIDKYKESLSAEKD